MALNDRFTIQYINLDQKELSYDINPKELEACCNNECEEHPSNKQPLQKFFVIKP